MSEPVAPRAPKPGATYALIVLTAMNLLNYVDRWVPSAVKGLLKADLKLSDQQTGLLLTSFIFVYMVASPIFGALAEKRDRKTLIAFGVAAWSLATAAAALATGFTSLLIARAAVGIGEAAYATLAPALLADYFPPERRNRVFTLFYVAIPVGSALGFVAGGALGEHFGWRTAFLAVGLPGLLVAALALLMKEPARGSFDTVENKPVSWPEAIRALLKNKAYVYSVAGYTAVTFGTGGMGDWFAEFLSRVRKMPLSEADYAIGLSAVVGGLVGTTSGGALADWLAKRIKQPYLMMSGAAMIPAVLLSSLALYVFQAPSAIVVTILGAQVFLWMYNAPINALIVNVVEPGMRARAVGLSIFCIHVFGDATSPTIIGALSDATNNLQLALALVPISVAIGGAVWLVGAKSLRSHDLA